MLCGFIKTYTAGYLVISFAGNKKISSDDSFKEGRCYVYIVSELSCRLLLLLWTVHWSGPSVRCITWAGSPPSSTSATSTKSRRTTTGAEPPRLATETMLDMLSSPVGGWYS